jgi:hypothetical protein
MYIGPENLFHGLAFDHAVAGNVYAGGLYSSAVSIAAFCGGLIYHGNSS